MTWNQSQENKRNNRGSEGLSWLKINSTMRRSIFFLVRSREIYLFIGLFTHYRLLKTQTMPIVLNVLVILSRRYGIFRKDTGKIKFMHLSFTFLEHLKKRHSLCPDKELMNSSEVTKLGRYPTTKRE